jgi:hypothetical protein
MHIQPLPNGLTLSVKRPIVTLYGAQLNSRDTFKNKGPLRQLLLQKVFVRNITKPYLTNLASFSKTWALTKNLEKMRSIRISQNLA